MAKSKKSRPPVVVPADLTAALAGNAAARAYFEKLPPSHKRAYLEYIDEAKKPETRRRHIEKTVAKLAEEADRQS
jgi:uncharacterized protein YdeI (YjbR/CyaY-like superfamily)